MIKIIFGVIIIFALITGVYELYNGLDDDDGEYVLSTLVKAALIALVTGFIVVGIVILF